MCRSPQRVKLLLKHRERQFLNQNRPQHSSNRNLLIVAHSQRRKSAKS